MAQCTKCKKSVGCGCQLVNGICDTCRKAEAEAKLKQQVQAKKIQGSDTSTMFAAITSINSNISTLN